MRIAVTRIPGLYTIELESQTDARGSFARLFCEEEFRRHGLETGFVQQSVSTTRAANTIRGIHYQRSPHQEIKFIRCGRGAIYDVVVDLRSNSPTFGQWQAFELSPISNMAIYIPKGCAHGFQSLVDDSEILYQMTVPYAPDAAAGLRYDDPMIGIRWPRPVSTIANKDLAWPPFSAQLPASHG